MAEAEQQSRHGLRIAAQAWTHRRHHPLVLAQQQRRQPAVIELEEIEIEGRVQKPNAFYILNRSNLGYEVLDLRTSFIREIVESVRREPF